MKQNVTSQQNKNTEINKRNVVRYSNQEANLLTRECVESALLMLMEEKDYASITITEIVRRAGVSRSAYYRNYSSKEDILAKAFQNALDVIMNTMLPALSEKNAKGVYFALFEQVQKESRLFEIITKANQEYQFLKEVNATLLGEVPKDDLGARYRLIAWIGSTFNLIFQWLADGMSEPPDKMADYCYKLFRE